MARRLVTTARCLRCPWTATGDWEATDKAAEKHTAKGHPTATETTWAGMARITRKDGER